MKPDEWYANQASKMIEADRNLRTKLMAMNDMYHAVWASPAPRNDVFWRDIVSATPHNIVKAVTQMYASSDPKVKLMPTAPNPETKAQSNKVEAALMWQYKLASKRSGNVTKDVMFNAVLYDRVCAQVIYLPWQNKIAKDLNARKWDMPGDFALPIYNPIDVHTLTSSLGLEAVLLVKDITVDELIALWGDAVTKDIRDQYNSAGIKTIRIFDWTDHEDRVVRVSSTGDSSLPRTDNSEIALSPDGITIFKEPHELPFLNWTVRSSASKSFAEPEHQIEPLLDSLFIAKQWDNLNIMESGMYSHLLKTFFAPGGVSKTADGEAPRIDYKNPEGIIALELEEQYTPIPKPQFDDRMATISQKLKNEIGEGTIPPILQNADTPSGAAYATINQLYKASESKTEDFKQNGQDVFTDIFRLMIQWYIHVHKPLTGYDVDQRKNQPKDEMITIDYRTLDPEELYLSTTLEAAKPIDKLQELNGAMLMKQLGIPMEKVFEDLGYEDPESLIKQALYDQYVQAAASIPLKKMQARGDAEAQKILMKAQQEAMPQQPQPGQEQAPPDQQQPQGQLDPAALEQQALARGAAGIPPEQQTGALAQLMAAGQGMNPAMGGMSPTELAPGQMTKENVTQRDRKGRRT